MLAVKLSATPRINPTARGVFRRNQRIWLRHERAGRALPIRLALLRDPLLGGGEPAPGDFDDDRVVDLLAEHHGPVWLACLGAPRQLWPVPPADLSELAPVVVDSRDDERGREFWACLRRTVSCGRDDRAAVAARKRMKQLDADMRALLMRDGVGRE